MLNIRKHYNTDIGGGNRYSNMNLNMHKMNFKLFIATRNFSVSPLYLSKMINEL